MKYIKISLILLGVYFLAAHVVPALIKAACWGMLCLFDFADIMGDKLAFIL